MMKNFTFTFFTIYHISAVRCLLSDEIKITGFEGQEAIIECSHSWAETNVKYFCNGKCSISDVLIKTEGGGKKKYPTKNGRFSLRDNGGGSFTVTITGLEKTDTGTYWCGVDRLGKDTFTKVLLEVTSARNTTTRTPPQSPIPPSANTRPANLQTSPPAGGGMQTDSSTPETLPKNSESPPHNLTTDDNTGKLIYLAVGLGVTVLVFALSLFIFITQRKNIRKPMGENVSSNRMNTVSQAEIPDETDCEYVELKDTFQQPCPDHNTASIYCNVNFPKDPPDSITYSTVVNFPKDPPDSITYSPVVNLPKDPPDSFTNSTVNLPKGSLYSTTYSTVKLSH